MSPRRIWHMVILVLFWSGTLVVPVSAQDGRALTLARVNITGSFSEVGLPVYAELQDSTGQVYALVLASAEQLAARGRPYQILDRSASGASYLITRESRRQRSPAGMRQIQQEGFALLHDDGRHWVLRARPGDEDRLASLGFDVQVMSSTPLVFRSPSIPAAPAGITPNPWVIQMLAQATQTLVYNYGADLSGVRPVTVGGVAYTLATRHTRQPTAVEKATQYTYERMQSLGLQVSYHNWTASGLSNRNVIGEKIGTVRPNEIVLITGHLDDMPNAAVAPGADDNASGAVGVLVAAEILSHHQFERTLRFVLFTGEEQGLLGSTAYADLVANQNIVAVYNMDMIAWDTINTPPVLELHTRTPANPGYLGDLQIAHLFTDVVGAYGLAANLTPVIVADGESTSDHYSFWLHAFPALLGIEDTANDFNPYYHSVDDTLSRLNLAYFTNFIKASVGTAAHLAYPADPILGIQKRVDPASPLAGDRLTYTLFVSNTGGAATNVAVQDRIPAQTTFAAAGSGGAHQAGEVTWQNLTLPRNGSLALTLAVTVTCVLTNTTILNNDFHVGLGLGGPQVAGLPVSVLAEVGPPSAAFTYPQPIIARWPVTFVNTSQHAHTYLWGFGDGTSSTAVGPAHTYTQPGVYNVTLQAANTCAAANASNNLRVDDYAVAAPTESRLHALPGKTVTHTVVFTNTGTLPETYQITAGAPRWPTVLSTSTLGPLAPGAAAPVQVRVTVPAGAQAGSMDEVVIKATAIHDPRQPAAAAASTLATTADVFYGVQVTPPLVNQTGDPGEIVQYALNVQNQGNASGSFAINLGEHAWAMVAAPAVGPLAPGSSAKTYISVSVPAESPPSAKDAVTVTVTSQADPARSASSRLTTTARAFYNAQVRPLSQEAWGNQGAIVTYGLRITNSGNIADTYYLEAAGQKWTAVPVATTVGPLPPGTGADFAVRVKIPDSLDTGIMDTAMVTATSQAAPKRYVCAQLVTHANAVYGLQIAPRTAGQSGAPGTVVKYNLLVTNTGNLADRFDVTIPSHNWPASPSPAVVGLLAPGAGGNLLVDVTVPAAAASGDRDMAILKVASRGQPAQSVTATLTTRAQHTYGVSLAPASQLGYGPAGRRVNYTLWISNTGSQADTFTVTTGSHTWPLGSFVSEVPLAAHTGATIGIPVFVPPVPAQTQDVLTISALSHGNPAFRASATLTTIWLRSQIWLPLLPR